jgi:hypothetical protein
MLYNSMFIFKKYDIQNHVWSFMTKYLRFLCKFTRWSVTQISTSQQFFLLIRLFNQTCIRLPNYVKTNQRLPGTCNSSPVAIFAIFSYRVQCETKLGMAAIFVRSRDHQIQFWNTLPNDQSIQVSLKWSLCGSLPKLCSAILTSIQDGQSSQTWFNIRHYGKYIKRSYVKLIRAVAAILEHRLALGL